MKSNHSLLLPFFAAALFLSPVHAIDGGSDCNDCGASCDVGCESNFERALDEKDWDALYDYINTKRTINVEEKASNLTISGDVKAQWRNRNEKDDEGSLRIIGKGDDRRYRGTNKFNIEFNLKFDYVCDSVWAVGQLQFDGCGGILTDHDWETDRQGMHGSGTNGFPEIKKAYVGYNVYCDKGARFDIEIGRRRLYQVFDSEVQFLSNFDGILLKYKNSVDWWRLGDWYINVAGFVVDARSDHYAYLFETGLHDICETGFEVKYSLVDWRKHGKNLWRERDAVGSKYLVSQGTMYYYFTAPYLDVPSKLFGAVLCNHDAKMPDWVADTEKWEDRNKKEKMDEKTRPDSKSKYYGDLRNFAWYAGFTLGEVVEQGDWAFTTQYQWVQARSIPDDDVSGIGNGNCQGNSFTADNMGNTNFKGWRVQGLYALKDNLTLEARFECSKPISEIHEFGGKHDFKQYRLAVLYAF